MTVSIRLAAPADRSVVETIVADAYRGYIARIGREPGPMLDDYAAQIEQGRVYLLEQGGAIQGLVVLIPEDGAMLLDNVAVRPDAQGRGFGRVLVEFAQQQAIAAGHPTLRLYTHERMVENIALYRRLGFVETHRAEEKGLRRVFMSKRLPLP